MTFSPTRHTPPLADDFKADIDWLLPALEMAWSVANNGTFKFDAWQVQLLRAVTELLPSGELRWRSCLVSMGRQNGKTELVSALGIWSLLRKDNQFSVSLASTAEQSRLVYERVQRVIASNPALQKMMTKLTDTRGIRAVNGSRYEVKASKASTLQGIPISVAIVDEVHLVDANAWDAVVSGTGARPDTLVVGITTAGDENSELLTRLYENAQKAIAGELDRFGAWIWEASEARVPEDDDELIALLIEANPALQSGRIDPRLLLQDVRALPDDDIIRYRLNRFVNTSNKAFIPFELWQKNERSIDDVFPDGELVFAVDRTPGWEHATVAVAVKVDDIIHTELVLSMVKPTLEKLVAVCQQLLSHSPRAILMDGYILRDLHNELKLRGFPSDTVSLAEIVNASSLFYARLARQTLKHAPDPLMSMQIPRTVRKFIGEGFRVSRKDSSVEIDSVMATLLAVYGAETLREVGLQVF
jgi:phage terminase large subunit-like protein